MEKFTKFIVIILFGTFSFSPLQADVSNKDLEVLNKFADIAHQKAQKAIGYPVRQDIPLHEFNEWFVSRKMDTLMLDNAGDPFDIHTSLVNTLHFEREVIEFFAPLYGIDKDKVWGLCSFSGTDGNNHGIYFGRKVLESKTGKKPIAYISKEAHYSNMRLCELQNVEFKIIPADKMGRMVVSELEKTLDPSRPALIIIAIGTTFKGAIDNVKAINKVIEKVKPIAVYKHADAALFGGFLPFTKYKDLVNLKKNKIDSIAISGHKFFGMDEPAGIFLTTKDVLKQQKSFDITYLNGNMPMINCSRSAVTPLKFWWLIRKVGVEGYTQQTKQIIENAKYLKKQLDKIGYPCWLQKHSNTVFFKKPSKFIMDKYGLAPEFDECLGGELAHIIIMQHVNKNLIDNFIEDMKKNN